MRIKIGKLSMLLLKLVLIIRLYCYHNLVVDAAVSPRPENLETGNEHHNLNGTCFDDGNEKNLQRTKRPARMIPAHYFIQKEKNSKENRNIVDTRFYGPASNCVEISKLGYTLNGFYMVKGKNQTKNNQVEVLGCRFKHPDGSKEVKEDKKGFIDIEITKSTKSVKRRSQEPFPKMSLEDITNVDERPKRPARLLPLKMILGKPKTSTKDESITPFYGPASSCKELERLGYTLNGLYLVDCKDKSLNGKIELIECRFKQPHGSKEAKEERIGFVNIEEKSIKIVQRRHLKTLKGTKLAINRGRNRRIIQRPARLLPLQLLYGTEEPNTENKKVIERFYSPPNSCGDLGKLGYTLNGYYLVNGTASSNQIEIVLCKFHQPIGSTKGLKEERFVPIKVLKFLPLDHGRNESYPLMNLESGKCLSYRGLSLRVQADCDPLTAKRWKFLNDGKQLCDINLTQCISVLIQDNDLWGILSLLQMLNDEKEKKNCRNCWLPEKYTQHVSVEKNQIRFIYGTQTNASHSYFSDRLKCFAASNMTGPFLYSGVTVKLCNDNYKNQTWSFVSFE